MSRPPRILSKTGLYHIIFRGMNRQNIFEEADDYRKLKEIIDTVKKDNFFEIYAYCLMTNHVHLFIKEQNPGEIKKIMHRILTRYVVWYNYKYQRSGSLIGNRYKSEAIEDESYVLTLVRYIHQNPIRAGITKEPRKYEWSSYEEYIKGENKFTDTSFVLSILSKEQKEAINMFKEYHEECSEEDFSISDTKRLTDAQVKRKIEKITKGLAAKEIAKQEKKERNQILARLREDGITIGQLERATGISRGIISRAKNVQKQARP